LAKQLGIASTPSFLIFKGGHEIKRFYGDTLVKDDIENFVNTFVLN